jgi:hypothetical protein
MYSARLFRWHASAAESPRRMLYQLCIRYSKVVSPFSIEVAILMQGKFVPLPIESGTVFTLAVSKPLCGEVGSCERNRSQVLCRAFSPWLCGRATRRAGGLGSASAGTNFCLAPMGASCFPLQQCLSAGAGLSIIRASPDRQPWYRLPVDQVLNRRSKRIRFPPAGA